MLLLFSDVLYMLVRYASPSGPVCVRCLMLTCGVVVFTLFYCRLDLCCGKCYNNNNNIYLKSNIQST